MGKGPKTRMKTISSSVDISTSSLRDDMNHGVEDEVDSNTIAPTHSNSLSTLALNDINYQITGLSSTKITSYILTNTIQPLISNIWNFYSQHFLHTDSRNVDNCQQLVNLLKELNSNILLISWNNENTIKTLKSLPNLLLDLVKIAMLYFSNPDFLSSLAQIEQMSSISIQLLQEHRLEKHCDLLLQDIPSYISIFSKSLDTLPLSLSNQEDDKHISQQIAPFLVKIFYLIESYSISYPNRKKLFLNGTTILLQPCLSLYASLLPFQQYSWIIKILKSIDIVLSKMFFDDIHHIEELTQIPLSLHITFGNDWIHLNNCESKKRKSESVKETGIKKQKVSNDKQAKQVVQSYHMSFYTALADWILNSSDESSEKSPPALSRLLQLYFHASKEMTNITERSGTFVQRWRLHIKRVLHIGLGLIYCICGNQQDDNLHLSSLKFRNRIIKTLNHGLSGDDSNNIQSIGAIPDHEILNLYVHKLGEIVEHTLTRSVKLSAAIGELSEKNFETLFLDIKFLRFSVELDCRVVSDSSLQSALRIIGSIFSWNAVKNSNLGNEGMKFFLKFLELYGDLRRTDMFIGAIFEDVKANASDKAFATLLQTTDVQNSLYHIFGTMADEQRNSCWEALLKANVTIGNQEFSSIGSCSFILSPLGLSVPPYRPVPEDLILYFFSQVASSLTDVVSRFQSNQDPHLSEDITDLLLLASIFMKIGYNFLSSTSFAISIPRYPYHIHNPALTDLDSHSANAEDVWIVFCFICSQFLFDVPLEFVEIAKDRLSVDIPNLFSSSTDSPLNVLSLFRSIIQFSETNSNMNYLENIFNCIVDLIFTNISLLSISSVQFSPLLQRCLEIDLTDSSSRNSASTSICCDLFQFINTKSGRSIILQFLNSFIQYSLFSKFPILCHTIFRHLEIWGCLFNSILLENDDSAIHIIKEWTDSLMKTIITDKLTSSSSSSLVDIFSSSKVQDFPFLLTSAGIVCRIHLERLYQTNSLQDLSILLEVMCSLPSTIFINERHLLTRVCSSIITQFYNNCHESSSKNSLVITSSLKNARNSLNFILRITSDILLNESYENAYELFLILLRTWIDSCKIRSFGEIISIITLMSGTPDQEELLKSLEELISILFIHCSETSSNTRDLFENLIIFLCGSHVESGINRMEHLLASISQELLNNFENQQKFNFFLKIFQKFSKSYLNSCYGLKLQSSLSSLQVVPTTTTTTTSHRINSLEDQLIKVVSLLTMNEGTTQQHRDAYYHLAGDLYLMSILPIHERNRYDQSNSSLVVLEKQLYSLAFPQIIPLGAGWIHYLTSYLTCNGKVFDSLGSRYLSLSSIKVIVGNIITSIEENITMWKKEKKDKNNKEMEEKEEYLFKINEFLQIFHSIIPCHLRERLVAQPLLTFLMTHLPTESKFIFQIFEIFLKISFSKWLNCSSFIINSYQKYLLTTICCYSERVILIGGEGAGGGGGLSDTSSPTSFKNIIMASNLYQLQLKYLLHHHHQSSKIDEKGEKESSHDDSLTQRQYDGVLLSLLNHSIIMFLSLTTSHLLPLSQNISSFNYLPEVIYSLISLLVEFLSSSSRHYTQLHSNAGILILIIRQLLVMNLLTLTSRTGQSNQHQPYRLSAINSLRLIGRILMILSSNKHLQRHSHLFIACIVDVLSGFSTSFQQSNPSSIKETTTTSSSSIAINDEMITISSHDETLRENLFPGIFALLDRCKTSKERKQIFAILDERSRLLYHDLYYIYQQDYKFIGKA